jgi:AraC-like DNA-binding protein
MDAFFLPVAGHPFYYLSCLYEFLRQVDENNSRLPAKYRRLQPALAELGAHPTRNEKIAYYAALCGMSEAGFRRLFGEYTGCSPVEYRNDLRLERARLLLQSGEYNVSEAAEAVGFTNLSFFIRLYKKKFGHTPKKE